MPPFEVIIMKNSEDNIEGRLLKGASLDKLIKMKMEEALKQELEKARKAPKIKKITDIESVPTDMIFSKEAVYKLFNKVSKIETFINGIQAEALLGLQSAMRSKIKQKEADAFSTSDSFVKFEHIELEDGR